MKSRRIALFATLVFALLAVVLFAAACGGQQTTGISGAATTIQLVTTSTTAAPTTTTAAPTTTVVAAATTLGVYKNEMKALWDQYGSKLDAMSSALNFADPTTLTGAQVQSLQDFINMLKGYVAGLEKTNAPQDLADAHAKYLEVLSMLSAGFDTFLTAAKAKDNAATLAAWAAVGALFQQEDAAVTAARSTLEQALGFSLTSGSSTTDTTAAGLGSDANTYTDPKYGYTFQYPATWEIDSGTTTDVTAGGSATSGVGAFDPNGTVANGIYVDLMVVSTYELNITVTDSMIPGLESEIQGVLSSLQSQATDAQVVSPLAPTEAAGLKGYSVTYTFTKDGVPTTSTLYFLFKGNLEYQLSTQASTVNWDKNQAIFAAMVASFTTR
jgi:hypothetical protein